MGVRYGSAKLKSIPRETTGKTKEYGLCAEYAAAIAARTLLREPEKLQERVVAELPAPGYLDLLDGLDIDHRLPPST